MKNLALILAAGKGTRMKSDLPKCLHEVAGASMVEHVLATAIAAGTDGQVVIIGHGGDKLKAVIEANRDEVVFETQTEQLGTGHAVKIAAEHISQSENITVILYGDSPLIKEDTVRDLIAKADDIQGPAVLGFDTLNPGKYGRLLTQGDELTAIREAKDATAEELAVTLCNSGVIACPSALLNTLVAQIDNENASEEYYLTDIIELARASGHKTGFILCDEAETQGVNTPVDLRAVSAEFQNMKREEFLTQGVNMWNADSIYFHHDTQIGAGSTIEPNVVFGPKVTIENNVQIRAFSHLEDCHICEGAQIGPYARIRPGSEIGDGARIGNFVETKNAQIAKGAKVNHLSYIGDTEIGEASNIGAGTITCNYDGVFKHKTKIGQRVFIGSNSSLVAPLEIGDDAMTGSGSIITADIPAGDLALGRAKQVNKAGLAKKFMDRLRALKAKK